MDTGISHFLYKPRHKLFLWIILSAFTLPCTLQIQTTQKTKYNNQILQNNCYYKYSIPIKLNVDQGPQTSTDQSI